MSHARLGPSNHRWPHCPGSIREEENYPDIAGDAAIDGTGSHLLLEMALEQCVPASAFIGQIIGANHEDKPSGWLIAEDRAERVQMCLDYVDRRIRELKDQFPGCMVTVDAESRSDPGGMFGRDDWWGTVDITIAATDADRCFFMEIVDYKDGRGWVHAENNTQLISYGAGKLRPFVASGPDLCRPFKTENVQGCRMTIVQPKTSPVVRYQDASPAEVFRQVEVLSDAARATDDPDAPLKSGKHCQWCKHKPNCTAESEQAIEKVKPMTTDVTADGNSLFEIVQQTFGDITALPSEKLTELADARAGIEAVFDKVDKEIQNRIETGEDVDGYAMMPGNSAQIWNEDEETIAKALKGRRLKKDQIYPAKLISPTQMMKMSDLTNEQKEKIKKQYISVKAGTLRLKKVARNSEQRSEKVIESFDKVVEQQTNNVVQSEPSTNDTPVSFI